VSPKNSVKIFSDDDIFYAVHSILSVNRLHAMTERALLSYTHLLPGRYTGSRADPTLYN